MVVLIPQSNRPVCGAVDVPIRSALVVGVVVGVVTVMFDFRIRIIYKLDQFSSSYILIYAEPQVSGSLKKFVIWDGWSTLVR